MSSRWLVSYIEEEFDRRREEEFQATLRRPDALPLPPAEPRASAAARLNRVVHGWLRRLPEPTVTRARSRRRPSSIR